MRPWHALIFTVTVCLAALLPLTVVATIATAVIGGPCEYEDSRWCHWDAPVRGNGEGRSFVQIGDLTIYVR